MSENSKQIVVVTGATQGIGLETAVQFLKLGYKVVGCSRSPENIASAKSLHAGLDLIPVDMGQKGEIKKFGDYVKSKKLPIHCLVNNVGVYTPGAFDECSDLQMLENQIQINLYSAAYMFQELKEIFITQKSGAVVNVSSIAGIEALPNSSLYCVSKFALQGYSKCLRQDMKKHNVRVITIMPGATYTQSWKGVQIPQDRFIPAVDVANMIVQAVEASPRTVVEEILIRPVQGDL